jgi:CheY-like chemotaxis protein
MTSSSTILLVEDNVDDVFLMRRALKDARVCNPVMVLESGAEAIDYLAGTGKYQDRDAYPLPVVVFLDLKLPFTYGYEVLAWIRQRREFESLIVVVLTSSNQASDLSRCYALGANSYVVKPPTAEQIQAMAKAFQWRWLQYAP